MEIGNRRKMTKKYIITILEEKGEKGTPNYYIIEKEIFILLDDSIRENDIPSVLINQGYKGKIISIKQEEKENENTRITKKGK